MKGCASILIRIPSKNRVGVYLSNMDYETTKLLEKKFMQVLLQ